MNSSAARWALVTFSISISNGIAGWFAHGTLGGFMSILVVSTFGALIGAATIDMKEKP